MAPVRAGCQLLLAYEVVQTGDTPLQSASLGESDLLKLKRALYAWTPDVDGCPISLVHPLDIDCDAGPLCLDNLDPSDQCRVQALEAACLDEDIDVYLASMVRIVAGEADENSVIGMPNEDRLQLSKLVTLQGQQVASDVDIEARSLTQKNILSRHRQPDEKEYDEPEADYSGRYYDDEERYGTHKYFDTVWISEASFC